LSHETCSYIRTYINAVSECVIMYLQRDFYNIIFKIKHKLYVASWSAPPPQGKIVGAHLAEAIPPVQCYLHCVVLK
jgi:hypothetical protein